MDILGEAHYYHRRNFTENTQKKIRKKSKHNSEEKHQNTREKTKRRMEQRGTAKTTSDFDIAVTGVKDIEGLREELDSIPTLYKIDLVDMDTCRNNLLMEDIQNYGCKIYQKI